LVGEMPVRPDKLMTEDEVVAELSSGMTIGIGGWGSRRKPMSLVRAILRSELRDLTIVSFGGPDVGMLCAADRVSRLIYGFVSLDSVPLDPHFRAARQAGEIESIEYDEGMLYWGLYAAACRLPFLPTRAGLGSAVIGGDSELRTVASPYDGEELVAMPAIRLDAALVHLNRADPYGNVQYLGPDIYFDDVFCMAAERAYVSCERVVSTESLLNGAHPATLRINRTAVHGVVPAPNGAHFTSCAPDYDHDERMLSEYVRAASEPNGWAEFSARYLDGAEAGYQDAVSAAASLARDQE
jgi:glutaconate CoA-transferase subunit A